MFSDPKTSQFVTFLSFTPTTLGIYNQASISICYITDADKKLIHMMHYL